jgi:hypothetical protein
MCIYVQVDVGTATDVATLTEPEMLGPCEPGTAVNLEGIVWHETDTGMRYITSGNTYCITLYPVRYRYSIHSVWNWCH